ncbi:probable cyclin-dependent serine/threonine-protein kinase DDB_G0278487 isoform X2 [Thrips palmi]|nr:probable cyclin-dependent serine/threonine-protein kinase DDB_G0278487 isoform X2 [Thrips palmi]
MVENSPVVVTWRNSKPPERIRSHSRTFRNPPQPHMCIQDFLEGSQEPCYINVLSWEKIALPSTPEDYIPLYGGMQVPHSPPSHSPVFAVMAHPEVLRTKGKHAADPQETHALVLMLLDFVELMNRNRGLHFARHFRILPDRDLAGELKNVWAAVQMKRAQDTAARTSMQHIATQEQQRQQQLMHQEEQIQRYRRQQQQLYKERQALAQREQRYRQQQQQQEDLQRRMDEFEMEKYLEQRHHHRLLHEQQRDQKRYDRMIMKSLEDPQTGESSKQRYSSSEDTSAALDFSLKRQSSESPCISSVCSTDKVHGSELALEENKLDPSSSASSPVTPSSSLLNLVESNTLKYREQEYLSTSASESDYTSDDGDSTDVDSELDGENENGEGKRHFLARVTVTVDSSDENNKQAKGGPDGDAKTLTH